MEKPSDSVDLFEVSRKCGAIKEGAAQVIFAQLVRTTLELHRAGVLHRDLKDENCLLDTRTLEVRLIDFGCATEKRHLYAKMAGTPEYFPPEWYSHRQYSADGLTVFSLGAILYILLTGTWEFSNGSHKRDFLAERSLSQSSRSLLDSLLCPFPSKRAKLCNIVGLAL